MTTDRLVIDAQPDTPAVGPGARSHCRFVLPFIHFILASRRYSVAVFLTRQRDRTLGGPARS
jgi:hypothetical protein